MREMKYSGFGWLGEIPCEWQVKRVKHGFDRKKQEAHQENPVVLSLARTGVRERDISNNEGQIAESYFNYNLVDIDDLLINPMDLYSGANCSISKVTGVISQAYINLRHKIGYDPRFYDYYFKVQYWMMAFFAHGKGVSYDNRWTLTADTLLNYPILVPPINEQKRIVEFLDDKCKKIDLIIDKQQAMIDKLKEYKLSIITETVTKGIDPNVETQKCTNGIIDRIPKHWNQARLGVGIALIQTGPFGSQLHAEEYVEDGYAFLINPANIQNGKIKADRECTISYEKANSLSQHIMDVGDIVFARRGEMGRCACIEDDKNKYFCGTGSIRLKCNDILNYKYANYYLQTSLIKQYLELRAVGTTMANLNSSIIAGIPMVYPPVEEQKSIVDYLEKTIEVIDKQITRRELLLDKMLLYRKSLIYEVITGKKEA